MNFTSIEFLVFCLWTLPSVIGLILISLIIRYDKKTKPETKVVEKSFKEMCWDMQNYLLKDRTLVIDMMNSTRKEIESLRDTVHWYENKIKVLNDKFANGVNPDEADEVSELYQLYKEELKEIGCELKELKNNFSHYSHILSIIDAKFNF